MAALRAKQRKRIARRNFAVPRGSGKRPGTSSYPIHDKRHARNALARVAQHGAPSEKRAVRRKVAAKYPSIGRSSGSKRSPRKSSARKRRR